MKSDNKKAILFLRPFSRHRQIIEHFLINTHCVLISDREIEDIPFSDRLLRLQDIVPNEILLENAKKDAAEKGISLFDIFKEHIAELPYSHKLQTSHQATIRRDIESSCLQFIYYYNITEYLSEQFNIAAIICSPSYIARNMGAVAAAKSRAIPTIHIQHGSYIDEEFIRPEAADYVFLSDEIGRNIISKSKSSTSKYIVTGMPFENCLTEEEYAHRDIHKQLAKEELAIPSDSDVILYSLTWFDSINATYAFSIYELIRSLQLVAEVVTLRNRAGQNTFLILKQHPFISEFEDELAYKAIMNEICCKEYLLTAQNPRATFQAADLVITSTVQTSMVIDSFAFAKPVITLNRYPRFQHPLADGEINRYTEVVSEKLEIADKINEILNDKVKQEQLGRAGYDYLRRHRPHYGVTAASNIVKNICDIVGLRG